MDQSKAIGYERISHACADIMAAQVAAKPESILCLATGGSPLGAYRLFVQKAIRSGVDVSKVVFVKLDEWHGIPMDNPATCETFLTRELYQPLAISTDKIVSFDSLAADPEQECGRIATILEQLGPIDLAILGIGRNGHLGLNEPGESLIPHAHPSELSEKTLGHAMLKETNTVVRLGMTLGIADLIRARHVVMMVSGEGKAEAAGGMKGNITPRNPASFLQLASNITILSETEQALR